MDRAHVLEDLVLHTLASRSVAAHVRTHVDSSHFDHFTSLVVLVADHDLHVPEAPSEGAGRRESIRAHIESLLQRTSRRGRAAQEFAVHDRRLAMANAALATLTSLADRAPSADVSVLLAHLLGHPVPAHVPRQPRRGPGSPRSRT